MTYLSALHLSEINFIMLLQQRRRRLRVAPQQQPRSQQQQQLPLHPVFLAILVLQLLSCCITVVNGLPMFLVESGKALCFSVEGPMDT